MISNLVDLEDFVGEPELSSSSPLQSRSHHSHSENIFLSAVADHRYRLVLEGGGRGRAEVSLAEVRKVEEGARNKKKMIDTLVGKDYHPARMACPFCLIWLVCWSCGCDILAL